jgi:DNA damage-inducible protein 1
MRANKHPKAFIQLLQTHEHLFKELNYHSPMLAMKLQNQPYEQAVQIWRDELVKGSIQGATAISDAYHKEKTMQARIQANPNDAEAKLYFEQKQNRQLVQEQYRHCMDEYPESLGRVLMLYIEAKINNHPLQAFVDSGAQMTIMGKKCAQRCGILHLLDTRFAGVAVGVGTGKILGTCTSKIQEENVEKPSEHGNQHLICDVSFSNVPYRKSSYCTTPNRGLLLSMQCHRHG